MRCLCFIASASAGQDYYKLLGVDKGVDDRTLKKVYRKLALEHHPDKVRTACRLNTSG